MLIREFNGNSDSEKLRECLIELQDFERCIDSRMPSGDDIADAYIAEMRTSCDQYIGKILIADIDGDLAGFVTILTKVESGDLDDGNIEYGLLADLVVRESYRGNGLGRALLAAAESVAKSHNVRWLRVCTLAQNKGARNLYASEGFSELYVNFEKDLSNGA